MKDLGISIWWAKYFQRNLFVPKNYYPGLSFLSRLLKMILVSKLNETALARSRTSAKCRLSLCSLFRILSISHCRSSIMDSRTDTRDSAVSTLPCNLENCIPKMGIQISIEKNKTKHKKQVRKTMPHFNTFFPMHEFKNEMTGSLTVSNELQSRKPWKSIRILIQGRLLKIQYFFYLWETSFL